MASGEIVKRLVLRANEADALISVLRGKVSAIRETLLASYFMNQESKLKEENMKYVEEINVLKKRLTETQHMNGDYNTKYASVKKYDNTTVESKKDDDVSKEIKVSAADSAGRQSPKKVKPPKKGQSNQNKAKDEAPVDIRRLDFRVAKIMSVKKHPDADSLYVEQVDVGEATPRTVVSGLVKFVPIERMENRLVILMCNLKPVKMRGVLSQAMVMCASTPEKVEILSPPPGSVPGELVEFEGYPSGVADAQLNPKKKIWEQVSPDLKTNEERVATYKGIPFCVANKGVVTSETLANVIIK